MHGTIEIIDLAGRKILSRTITNTNQSFDIPTKGIFIARILNAENVQVFAKKVFIK